MMSNESPTLRRLSEKIHGANSTFQLFETVFSTPGLAMLR